MDRNRLAEIILRVQKNERSAFEELYDLTFKPMYYLAFKILRNEDDSNDAVQEAYTSIFRYAGSVKNPMAVFSWMCQITVNKCNDLLSKRMANFDGGEEKDNFLEQIEETDESFLPEGILEDTEKRRMVLQIIDSLHELQKRCIILYYYEECSVAEIAEILSCSEGTVKSRLNYARKYIKGAVMEEEKRGVKLYSAAAGLPILTILLREEAEGLSVNPYIIGRIFDKAMTNANNLAAAHGAASAKASLLTKMGLVSLKAKIIAGVAAAIIGISAAASVVIIKGQKHEVMVASEYKLSQEIYNMDTAEFLGMSEEKALKILGQPGKKKPINLNGKDTLTAHTYSGDFDKLNLVVIDSKVSMVTISGEGMKLNGVKLGDNRETVKKALNVSPSLEDERKVQYKLKNGMFIEYSGEQNYSKANPETWKVTFMYCSYYSGPSSSEEGNASANNSSSTNSSQPASNTENIKKVLADYKVYYTNQLKKREFQWWVRDFNGDGVPEMLIAYGPTNSFTEPFYEATIDIYGYKDNKVLLLSRKVMERDTRNSYKVNIVSDSSEKYYIKITDKITHADSGESFVVNSIAAVEGSGLKEISSVIQYNMIPADSNQQEILKYYSASFDYDYSSIKSPKTEITKSQYDSEVNKYSDVVMIADIEAGDEVRFEEMEDTLPNAFAYWEKCSDEQLKKIFGMK